MRTRQYVTKADHAAEELRTAIRRGDYRPGERIDIHNLARGYRMSVTPVREALRLLAAEGIVAFDPHRGARVVEFDEADLDELYLVRSEVESLATRLSTPRLSALEFEELERLTVLQREAESAGNSHAVAELSVEWHRVVYSAAGTTPYLREFIDRLLHAVPWAAVTAPNRDHRVVADHVALLSILRAGDASGAGEMMRRHILSGRDFVVRRQPAPSVLASVPRSEEGRNGDRQRDPRTHQSDL